jgi:RNA polymerase sigma factor (sigma-70 family)
VSNPPFEAVVTAHGATVLRVCRALLGGGDAEDAAADALLAALEAYPRLRPGSDVKAWLVTIAHRKAIDILRRRQRQALPLAELPDAPDSAHHSASDVPDDALWALVRALPAKQRHAVVYRYVADLAYPDVAALLGSSEAAARRSAADGIKNLRMRYNPSEEQIR